MSFDEESYRARLSGPLGFPLRYLETTGSTNDDALAWASTGAPHGAVVVAGEQAAGRGRWSRSWAAPAGSGLLFSVVLRLGPASEHALLTTAAGVALAEAIERTTGLACGIKWPNDVLIEGRKLAGVLVEARSAEGRGAPVVCGVGVNLRHGPEDFPPEVRAGATSLALEGAAVTAEELLAHSLDGLAARLGALSDPGDAEALVEVATERSIVTGHRVKVVSASGRELTGIARGLTVTGALLLDTDDGQVEVTSGEVERLRVAEGG